MGDVPGGNWTLDPQARHAMLLEASREAIGRGAYAEAVALAEELLDECPDDTEALLLVADAAPRYGHAEVGILAAKQAAFRGADVAAAEAAALLAACQVERALEVAETLLLERPDLARAHAIRGQALELLGRLDDARGALARAAALNPTHFPPPLDVETDAWDSLLFEAISGLEPSLRDALRRVDVVFADLPVIAQLQAIFPPPSPLVDALLQEADGKKPRIVLYRRNLVRGTAHVDELAERLREALQTEAEILLEGGG